jgi:hypothetical protein
MAITYKLVDAFFYASLPLLNLLLSGNAIIDKTLFDASASLPNRLILLWFAIVFMQVAINQSGD